jgi:hypothetical protein
MGVRGGRVAGGSAVSEHAMAPTAKITTAIVGFKRALAFIGENFIMLQALRHLRFTGGFNMENEESLQTRY